MKIISHRYCYAILLGLYTLCGAWSGLAQELSPLRQLEERLALVRKRARLDSLPSKSTLSDLDLASEIDKRIAIAKQRGAGRLFGSLMALPPVIRYRDLLSQDQEYSIAPPSLSLWAAGNTPFSLKYTKPKLSEAFLSTRSIQKRLQREHIGLFRLDSAYLAQYREELSYSRPEAIHQELLNTPAEGAKQIDRYEGISELQIEERHWIPSLQSSIQFAQNYISSNWYKGGASNLNLVTRNRFSLLYSKERIEWLNVLEYNLSIYSSPADTIRKYSISEDRLRFRSNFGLRAINKLYYSLDAELKTQLLNSYKVNSSSLLNALFAPLTVNIGLGLKYDFSWKSKKVYGRNFAYSLNVAPLSYTYRGTRRVDIDLAPFGLSKEKSYYHKFGSTIRMSWTWNFNMRTSWQSRVFFNTSYQNIEAEWENTLDLAISRYFATRLSLNLRFDDAVQAADTWYKHLQINELISFGFSLKL